MQASSQRPALPRGPWRSQGVIVCGIQPRSGVMSIRNHAPGTPRRDDTLKISDHRRAGCHTEYGCVDSSPPFPGRTGDARARRRGGEPRPRHPARTTRGPAARSTSSTSRPGPAGKCPGRTGSRPRSSAPCGPRRPRTVVPPGHGRRSRQAGRNVIISTGAASGKSLGYLLPALTAVLAGETCSTSRRPRPWPLTSWPRSGRWACPASGPPPWTVTRPAAERAWARCHAEYLLTNPDMLHHALLPGHPRWSGFFSRLRYVIDRRVPRLPGGLRLARGARAAPAAPGGRAPRPAGRPQPVFMLASATAGRPVTCAGADRPGRRGGHRGRLAARAGVVRPVGAAADRGPRRGGRPVRRTATAEAAELLGRLVREDVATLAFIRSRRGAEAVALAARRSLERRRQTRDGQPGGGPPRRRWRRTGRATWPRTGAAGGGAVRRAAGRPGHHDRARAGGQHHRPGRGAHRRMAGHLGVALAAGGPGRARRPAAARS